MSLQRNEREVLDDKGVVGGEQESEWVKAVPCVI